jgi:hypothetical protein
MSERRNPVAEFNQHVPEMFLKDVVRGIEESYRAARTARDAYGLGQPHAEWNEPYIRRALIESRMQEVASKYKSLAVDVVFAGRQSSPYVVVKAGPIVLTESMVDGRCQLPREAAFRKQNARFNYGLFSQYEEELPDDTPIYAILSHVPHWKQAVPQFVDVIFPNVTYDGIIGTPFDLKQVFGSGVYDAPVAEEKISEPTPELKKNQKKRKAD